MYCRADRAEDSWTVVSAWLNALPTDSVLSGPTAAWLHGLDLNPANPVEVISEKGSPAHTELVGILRELAARPGENGNSRVEQANP